MPYQQKLTKAPTKVHTGCSLYINIPFLLGLCKWKTSGKIKIKGDVDEKDGEQEDAYTKYEIIDNPIPTVFH